MNKFKYKYNDADMEFTFGEMAKQAQGSVFGTYGKTDFLVTLTTRSSSEGTDFFPLTVNFEEKLYAIGKIPGNFQRREAKPSEYGILNSRIIDRALRPLFPKGFHDEVQITITLLGYNKDFDISMLAICAASMIIFEAGLPFEDHVAGTVVGKIGDDIIISPTEEQKLALDCELRVSGTNDALNMIEFKGTEQSEEEVLDLMEAAHNDIREQISWQKEILKTLDKPKVEFLDVDIKDNLYNLVRDNYNKRLMEIMRNTTDRVERGEKFNVLKEKIIKDNNFDEDEINEVNSVFSKLVRENFIDLIVRDKYRLDGRRVDEIRPLSSRVNVIQEAHGSALFTRGETQSLSVVTLGVKNDAQILDGLEDQDSKRFMLHYNFPAYSVGEVRRVGPPGRREIGHGNLAEKALAPMLPSYEDFPYVIRDVSEILESNGSSSQATVCAGTLALLAAGVPMKKHVAGIAMGLIQENDEFTILTDIAGLEDHLGNMDFKIAGTRDGITAIQMDIKVNGINREIFTSCFKQAKVGRMELLDHLESIIKEPQPLAPSVMKVEKMTILPVQIKEVIGRGGEVINKIIDATGVKIEIEEDGTVLIYGTDLNAIAEARKRIDRITKIYKVGEEYTGTVRRVEKYGIFVNFDGSQEALVHISDLNLGEGDHIEEKYKIGDKVNIVIKSVDEKKRMKAALYE